VDPDAKTASSTTNLTSVTVTGDKSIVGQLIHDIKTEVKSLVKLSLYVGFPELYSTCVVVILVVHFIWDSLLLVLLILVEPIFLNRQTLHRFPQGRASSSLNIEVVVLPKEKKKTCKYGIRKEFLTLF
jgi:hypothetical protein